MSERRPRLSKKLNSNDRNAMVRIMTVLLRNCIAVPPKLDQLQLAESKRKTTFGRGASGLFSEGISRKGDNNLRKFVL